MLTLVHFLINFDIAPIQNIVDYRQYGCWDMSSVAVWIEIQDRQPMFGAKNLCVIKAYSKIASVFPAHEAAMTTNETSDTKRFLISLDSSSSNASGARLWGDSAEGFAKFKHTLFIYRIIQYWFMNKSEAWKDSAVVSSGWSHKSSWIYPRYL